MTTVVLSHLVSVSWVARYYGVTTREVYYAISRGKIKAYKVEGDGTRRGVLVIDRTSLPTDWPMGRAA